MLGTVKVKCSEVIKLSVSNAVSNKRLKYLGCRWICKTELAGHRLNPRFRGVNPKLVNALFWGALCPSKSGLMNKHIVKHIAGAISAPFHLHASDGKI